MFLASVSRRVSSDVTLSTRFKILFLVKLLAEPQLERLNSQADPSFIPKLAMNTGIVHECLYNPPPIFVFPTQAQSSHLLPFGRNFLWPGLDLRLQVIRRHGYGFATGSRFKLSMSRFWSSTVQLSI